MQVYEAAGSGLQNHHLVHNVLAMGKFTVNGANVTSNSANRGLGLANATSASGLYTLTWAASAFGTASAPNIEVIGGNAVSTNFGIGAVSSAGTAGAILRLGILKMEVTASGAVSYDLVTAATPFNVVIFPYSATGTQFTFATA